MRFPATTVEPVLASCSRSPMLDLDATYSRLAGPWSHEQLAARYDFGPAQTLNLKGKGATRVYRLSGRRGPSAAAD